MIRFKFLIALMMLVCSINTFALDADHVLWDKTPIPITLSLNEERLIHFPQAISIVDNEADEKIAVLKVQDSLYLKAKEPFTNQRLLVQLMPQGDVIILTLSASENIVATKPIDVLLESHNSEHDKIDNTVDFDFNAVTLTRFAIQSLYAPARLLIIPEGVDRVPMQTQRKINLVYGASVAAYPLISWQGGSLYVTAIELKNLLKKEITLDPRRLLGHWQTASFYPTNTLEPRGENDTTTLFLVSERPFNDAFTADKEFVR
ncbi:TIGR03749 family integrating conjugative element protein [Legionella sp. D16C41]|uniref:TIGR03749 family integrating conjugative element protein n=1 Tax=Legionella sp. D16C41 TaxID=3402688 RepID=UPI003AF4E1BE